GEERLRILVGTEGDSLLLMDINTTEAREDQEKVFFGIRADNRVFDRYRRLLMEPEATAPRGELAGPTSIPATTRIRIVNFVLNSKMAAGDTLQDLVKDGVFEAGFPLHKGEEDLKKKWARWRNMFQQQPIGDIRRVRCRPQEEMALGLIACPDYQPRLHQHSYMRSTVILLLSLLMICLMIGMAHVLVIYRVLAAALFSSAFPFLGEQVTTAVVVTGALVHYVSILVMTKVGVGAGRGCRWGEGLLRSEVSPPSPLPQINKYVALKLCDFEKPRTFSERESKFTIKFFTLQFFAHFSSLIYIAFILGRLRSSLMSRVGCRPLQSPSISEVMPGRGCEQSAISSGSRQCTFTLRDIAKAPSKNAVLTHKATHCVRDCTLHVGLMNKDFSSLKAPLLPDSHSCPAPSLSLAALPRINGNPGKSVRLAGLWKLEEVSLSGGLTALFLNCPNPLIIGVLAVIANGMVIAFTSEFIPRVVYKYRYGPCRQGAHPAVDCLTGYVNHSLSVFYTKDFQNPVEIEGSENVTECRYRDYGAAQNSTFTEQSWFLLAIRLAFLILFEHVALCVKLIAAWFVPDVPQSVKNEVLKKKHQRLGEAGLPGPG
ncbi:hypothetical protein E2I00_019890, partial [Balaenoptera physalus]